MADNTPPIIGATVEQRLAIAEAIISRARHAVRQEFQRDQVMAILNNPLPVLGADNTAPTTRDLIESVRDRPTITRLSHMTQIEKIEELRDALAVLGAVTGKPDEAQKLDPLPWLWFEDRRYAVRQLGTYTTFSPRPEYEQDKSKYRVGGEAI